MKFAAFDVETIGTQDLFALQACRARTGQAKLSSAAFLIETADNDVQLRAHLHPTTAQLRGFLNYCFKNNQTICTWNGGFDISWLIAAGLREEVMRCRWLDGMLLWRHTRICPTFEITKDTPGYGLKEAVAHFLPYAADYNKDVTFNPTTPEEWEQLRKYNGDDASYTQIICKILWAQLTPQQQRAALIEAACIPMIAETLVEGVKANANAAIDLQIKLNMQSNDAYQALKVTEPDITPQMLASPVQLRRLLVDKWGLPPVVLTEKGDVSTNRQALKIMAVQDPRAELVNTYREARNNCTKFAEGTIASVAYNGDGYVRPAHRIYGTYCVPGDVEVLTRHGWEPLRDWRGGDIVQVHKDTLSMEFLPATRFEGPLNNQWVRVNHQGLRCDFTPGHTVLARTGDSRPMSDYRAEQLGTSHQIPVSGRLAVNGRYTPQQMRVFAMVQADGCFYTNRGCVKPLLKFTFKKPRKIGRARELLSAASIPYREYVCAAYPERVEIHCGSRSIPAWLTQEHKFLGAWLLDTTTEGLKAFVDELVNWDGSPHPDGGVKYTSANAGNVAWAVTTASLVGYKANHHAEARGMSSCHISHEAPFRFVKKRHVTRETYIAKTYCATTMTGYWLARSKGTIFVTGNTGRMSISASQGRGVNAVPTGIPLHQWKRDPEFRGLIDAPPGYDLAEFDFAGQEFRWLAVVSNDSTMLGLCEDGEDAHSFMAASIVHEDYRDFCTLLAAKTPGYKDKRQLGKVANLSLGYRTSAKTLMTVAAVQHNIKLSFDEAQKIWKTYQQTYPMVPAYWRRQMAFVKRNNYVENPMGRRVWLKQPHERDKDARWSYDSTAINFPIQSAGACQKYLALMVLKNLLPQWDARFYFELHDGLFVIIPHNYTAEAVPAIKHALSNLPYKKAFGLDLPIQFPVDAKVGTNWGNLKEVH